MVARREDGRCWSTARCRSRTCAKCSAARACPDEDEHDYHTAAGMVIAHFGRIPHVGEHFDWDGWRIEVVDLDGPRIDKLLLQRLRSGNATMHDAGLSTQAHAPRAPARAPCSTRFAEGDPDDVLTLRRPARRPRRRAFGMLLFVCVLPAFIPIPVGGAISGPLVMLIGLQLLIGLRKPWLPEFIGRRGPHRHAIVTFRQAPGARGLRGWSSWCGRACRGCWITASPRRSPACCWCCSACCCRCRFRFTNYLFGATAAAVRAGAAGTRRRADARRVGRWRRLRSRCSALCSAAWRLQAAHVAATC